MGAGSPNPAGGKGEIEMAHELAIHLHYHEYRYSPDHEGAPPAGVPLVELIWHRGAEVALLRFGSSRMEFRVEPPRDPSPEELEAENRERGYADKPPLTADELCIVDGIRFAACCRGFLAAIAEA